MNDRETYLEERVTRLESDMAEAVRTLGKVADCIDNLAQRIEHINARTIGMVKLH